MDAIVFGAFLKERRAMLGLTQAELAGQLHVTAKAVSRWERGVGFPDINSLEPLADALDVSLLELMQSRVLPDEAVSNEDASAAVADALSFAGARKLGRVLKWIENGCLGVMIAAHLLLIVVLLRYVTTPWIRGISLVALWLVIGLNTGLFALRKAADSPVPPTKQQVLRWTLTALGRGLFLIGLFLKTANPGSSGNLLTILGLGILVVRDWWKGGKLN